MMDCVRSGFLYIADWVCRRMYILKGCLFFLVLFTKVFTKVRKWEGMMFGHSFFFIYSERGIMI